MSKCEKLTMFSLSLPLCPLVIYLSLHIDLLNPFLLWTFPMETMIDEYLIKFEENTSFVVQ